MWCEAFNTGKKLEEAGYCFNDYPSEFKLMATAQNYFSWLTHYLSMPHFDAL